MSSPRGMRTSLLLSVSRLEDDSILVLNASGAIARKDCGSRKVDRCVCYAAWSVRKRNSTRFQDRNHGSVILTLSHDVCFMITLLTCRQH